MSAIHRKIRIPPQPPTPKMLRAVLNEYGINRWRCAQIMSVAEVTVERYLLPLTSKHNKTIQKIRWDALQLEIKNLDKLYT